MPKSLIVYFSQGGTTALVAKAIASSLQLAGYQVDICNIKDEMPPDVWSYDLLGIAAALAIRIRETALHNTA